MRRRQTSDPQDRGAALLLAVGALAVVAILGAVLLQSARGEIRHAERMVGRAATGSTLDVAVAAAWGGIVAGADRTFSDSGTTSAGPWSFTATPVDSRRWTLLVEAGEGVDALTGRITIAREALLPYSLLVEDARTGPLLGRVVGRIGIRGTARFLGRPVGDVQELIGASARCVGCDNPVAVEFGAAVPAAPATLPAQACPDTAGTITGLLAGGATYVCHTPGTLIVSGAVDIDGPVVLDVGPDVELQIDRATMNFGGDPADLIVSQANSNGAGVRIDDSTLHGILIAPESRVETGGFTWTGMVVAGDLRTDSGTELTGSWAPTLESFGFAGWRITSWDTERS